jgi:ubiquinone/menaquinone biosynthesis C-methylase UbiE
MASTQDASAKLSVRDHWEAETCGTRDSKTSDARARAIEIKEARYRYIPEIPSFADFASARDKKVLEIGVGAGTDFSQWVAAGADAYGVDLTDAAIRTTSEHLNALGLPSRHINADDAEALSFPAKTFDIVYSWGVLHHSPDTEGAFREACRVLKPGGRLLAMIYHSRSWMALWYWARFGLLKGRPFQSPRDIIAKHMESPNTKVFSIRQAKEMLERCGFSNITITPRLMQGDLFEFKLSERYDNRINRIAYKMFPRPLIRATGHRFGGMLLIKATRASL